MILAVIPARGGSKRIPRKNIRDFCRRPIIAWSIRVALESDCFDRVMVSTDDAMTADVARSWGAEVPFMRPQELADEHTGTTPAVGHAVAWQQAQGITPDAVCCIYATAPFLRARDLQAGYNSFAPRIVITRLQSPVIRIRFNARFALRAQGAWT